MSCIVAIILSGITMFCCGYITCALLVSGKVADMRMAIYKAAEGDNRICKELYKSGV